MTNQLKTKLRRRLRAFQRANQFLILLPHHRIENQTLKSINGTSRPLPKTLASALGLCDGRTTLREVVRWSKVPPADLIQAQEEGLLVVWRSPISANVPTPRQHPHAIIVSPHPDDAALSCGARMLGDHETLVVNVFTQSAWWRFDATDVQTIQAIRNKEEEFVSRVADVPMIALNLPEALLRGHQVQDIFSANPDARDAAAIAALEHAIKDLAARHPLAHWYLPLGVGHHIDHRIVRDASRAALENVAPTHVHFYEDLPYAAADQRKNFPALIPGLSLKEEILEIDELLPWKMELLRAYWSQFEWAHLAEVKSYAKAIGGEAVWQAV